MKVNQLDSLAMKLSTQNASQRTDIAMQSDGFASDRIITLHEEFIDIFDFSIVNKFRENIVSPRSCALRYKSSMINRFVGELEKETDAAMALCSLNKGA